jgi:hypothetical protein
MRAKYMSYSSRASGQSATPMGSQWRINSRRSRPAPRRLYQRHHSESCTAATIRRRELGYTGRKRTAGVVEIGVTARVRSSHPSALVKGVLWWEIHRLRQELLQPRCPASWRRSDGEYSSGRTLALVDLPRVHAGALCVHLAGSFHAVHGVHAVNTVMMMMTE